MSTRNRKGPGSPGPAEHNRFRDDWSVEEKPPGNALIEEFLLACAPEDPCDPWFLELLPRVIECLERYDSHEAATLDEAFNASRPPGYRFPAARSRARNRGRVQHVGVRLRDAGAVTDDAFFEVLGEIGKVSGSQARVWFYESHLKLQPRTFSTLPPQLERYRDRLNWLDP